MLLQKLLLVKVLLKIYIRGFLNERKTNNVTLSHFFIHFLNINVGLLISFIHFLSFFLLPVLASFSFSFLLLPSPRAPGPVARVEVARVDQAKGTPKQT